MAFLLRRAALPAGVLCLCLACGIASAAAQARLVSSTWLPGGKYAQVYELEGAEYMTLSADPPGARVAVPDATEAAKTAPAPALVVSHADVFPNAQSYVGGFFVDPISAALRATGLGLLLGDGWPRGGHRLNR